MLRGRGGDVIGEAEQLEAAEAKTFCFRFGELFIRKFEFEGAISEETERGDIPKGRDSVIAGSVIRISGVVGREGAALL